MIETAMHENLILTEEAEWKFIGPRTTFLSRDAILRAVVPLAYQIPGEIIEFGVADGGSTRVIRGTANKMERFYGVGLKKRIFACDSFEGLSEKYENAEIGAFACEPPRISGVEIIKGYFDDSLTEELADRVGQVAFASLDADLYSSTLCALNWLTPLLRSGSLLLFDEFLGEQQSEKRAFEDWSKQTGIKTIQIGYFLRDPSGWGNDIDARALYQVVSDEPLHRQIARWNLTARLKKRLRHDPELYEKVRTIYRRIQNVWRG